jgi:hypothetical protein
MIKDDLKVLEVPELKEGDFNRNKVAKMLLNKQKEIEEFFDNDEYIKLDMTNMEIIGLKSTSVFGKTPIGDLPAIDFAIRNNEKYKDSNIVNLGNVSLLYKELPNTKV